MCVVSNRGFRLPAMIPGSGVALYWIKQENPARHETAAALLLVGTRGRPWSAWQPTKNGWETLSRNPSKNTANGQNHARTTWSRPVKVPGILNEYSRTCFLFGSRPFSKVRTKSGPGINTGQSRQLIPGSPSEIPAEAGSIVYHCGTRDINKIHSAPGPCKAYNVQLIERKRTNHSLSSFRLVSLCTGSSLGRLLFFCLVKRLFFDVTGAMVQAGGNLDAFGLTHLQNLSLIRAPVVPSEVQWDRWAPSHTEPEARKTHWNVPTCL